MLEPLRTARNCLELLGTTRNVILSDLKRPQAFPRSSEQFQSSPTSVKNSLQKFGIIGTAWNCLEMAGSAAGCFVRSQRRSSYLRAVPRRPEQFHAVPTCSNSRGEFFDQVLTCWGRSEPHGYARNITLSARRSPQRFQSFPSSSKESQSAPIFPHFCERFSAEVSKFFRNFEMLELIGNDRRSFAQSGIPRISE